jgi:nicotinate phosphoribosyltransferase
MLSAHSANGMNGAATFSLFVRQLPNNRNFLVACGLDRRGAWLLARG